MKQNTSEGSKNETKTTKAQGHYLEKNLTETRTDDKGKDENFFVLQARVDDSLLPENERRYVTLKGFMGRPLTLFLQGRAGRLGSGKARFQESPKGENGISPYNTWNNPHGPNADSATGMIRGVSDLDCVDSWLLVCRYPKLEPCTGSMVAGMFSFPVLSIKFLF
ncbi:hypothetical protein QQP08_024836 [Theobroma cacao]|nr:hypothetical protein QQP08_024836 [Theobroma cacao]